jgi:hypothetical protein
MFFRDKPKPCGHVARASELPAISGCGNQCGCGDRANPGDCHQPTRAFVILGAGAEAAAEEAHRQPLSDSLPKKSITPQFWVTRSRGDQPCSNSKVAVDVMPVETDLDAMAMFPSASGRAQ